MWAQLAGTTDRWTLPDPYTPIHLLLHQGTVLVELHDWTIHVYRAPAEIVVATPLTGASYLWTRELPGGTPASEAEAWPIMQAHATETPPED